MSTVEQVKPAPVRTGEREPGGIAGWWGQGRTFLTEVRNEMRRVTWPGRKEVWATTVVVIIVSVFFGLYLWGLDMALDWAWRLTIRSFGAA